MIGPGLVGLGLAIVAACAVVIDWLGWSRYPGGDRVAELLGWGVLLGLVVILAGLLAWGGA